MRARDLHHSELLEFDPDGGVIHFAGQRALLLDATAMGLLRKYLAENFGLTAARTVLTQFGFAQGWRMAEAIQAEFNWDDPEDWLRAGLRIHALGGLFRVEMGSDGPLTADGVTISASYEAEQHLLYFGRSEVAVCWTVCGLMSGYASRVAGKEIYVLEDSCAGKGDAACHLLGRTREAWGDERADELGYFEGGRLQESLDVSLQRVTDTLKDAEARLRKMRRVLSAVSTEADDPSGIVARSGPMRQLADLACRVAKVDVTVLITGESGSGKERIARLVHEESQRSAGPFVAVNCGAITETLLESELFGHTRGSFTGASSDRAGLFEAANHGTLLLDEIGEVSPAMQVKLLRVLQEREVRRVGENRARKIDVRIIAATNRDLSQIVGSGGFRQDLFYRLKVVELHLPALRDRHDDILPLARLLLAAAAIRMDRTIGSFSPAVAERLLGYPWPGNVRELENAMERGVALAQSDRIEVHDLPEEIRLTRARVELSDGRMRPLEDIEREHILATLDHNDGNQAETARQLHIGSATLYRKLKAFGHLASQLAADEKPS
jgi:DNA-binding NtrC family response regulator/predicted hydrocarbon binding protein